MNDPIIEEVRKVRDEHAARFNYDIDEIYADLKRLEAASNRPRVSLDPRRLEKPVASASWLRTTAPSSTRSASTRSAGVARSGLPLIRISCSGRRS